MFARFRWKIAQRLESAWWRSYLKKKPVEDYLEWKKNYWRDFLKCAGADHLIIDGTQILDIGCGPAGIFTVLDQAKVTAVDPLLDRYETELAHFSRKNYRHVKFICTDFEAAEISENFELIFCLNAINHVHDFEAFVQKMANLLQPNAKLFITIDTHNYKLLKFVARLFPFLDPLHPWQYDLEEYRQLFEKGGLRFQKHIKLKKRFVFDYDLLVMEKA